MGDQAAAGGGAGEGGKTPPGARTPRALGPTQGQGAGFGVSRAPPQAGGPWNAGITEEEYYTRLHEAFIAPAPKMTPERELELIKRASHRLRHASRWRLVPEVDTFRRIRLWGAALRLTNQSKECAWCCCPFAPCACITMPTNRNSPYQTIPVVQGASLWSTMWMGRRALDRPYPDSSWEGPAGIKAMARRLWKAAAEGCSCPLKQVGPPICPAEQLDFACSRGQKMSYEMRRQLRVLLEMQQRENGQYKEEMETETFTAYGKKLRRVNQQTVTDLNGQLVVGEGRIMCARPPPVSGDTAVYPAEVGTDEWYRQQIAKCCNDRN